ncbi:MAG: hypothetical protein DRJ03_25015 [Chloroflexi bacterium]|nr:MAG: hypothetical protein DRJ03_25015 [Chloroflexota bacterium]
MAYSSEMDVRKNMPDATADVISSLDIQWAIAAADAYIDSRLSQRFATPFSPVPNEINILSTFRATYLLMLRYPDRSNAEDLERLEKTIEELLDGYLTGVLKLSEATELTNDERLYVYNYNPEPDDVYDSTRLSVYD